MKPEERGYLITTKVGMKGVSALPWRESLTYGKASFASKRFL
jgi:hypothetical protein